MEAQHSVWTKVGVQNCIVTLCVCFVLFVIIVKIVNYLRISFKPDGGDVNSDSVFGQCRFPDCIRCRRQKDVLMRARTRLTYHDDNQREKQASSMALLLKDVHASYHMLDRNLDGLLCQNVDLSSQIPLIFRVRGVRAQAWWNTEEFSGLEHLSENYLQIKSEFDELFKLTSKDGGGYWKVNDSSSGRWWICHLLDQGLQTKAVHKCPITWRILSHLPGLMTDNLFGNVAFSVVEPGTTISPHFGPTNIRIRCHLGLDIPEGCQLQVGEQSEQWSEGKMLCFDDTYLHSVRHKGAGQSRIILLLDLWHPDLDSEQRSLINYAFSPVAGLPDN